MLLCERPSNVSATFPVSCAPSAGTRGVARMGFLSCDGLPNKVAAAHEEKQLIAQQARRDLKLSDPNPAVTATQVPSYDSQRNSAGIHRWSWADNVYFSLTASLLSLRKTVDLCLTEPETH